MSPDQSKPDVTRALANAICAAREKAGLTADVIAERAGLETSDYSAIERGERPADVETIVQIGRALDTTASELLERAAL